MRLFPHPRRAAAWFQDTLHRMAAAYRHRSLNRRAAVSVTAILAHGANPISDLLGPMGVICCVRAFRLRPIITAVCIGASFIAHAADQPTPRAKGVSHHPIATELQPLQGKWEGVMVGHEKDGAITITITSNSLHFHRDTNFWFETTFVLPAGKDPKQLHATIKRCPVSQADSIGQVVRAFFKIEDGTLTLATIGDDAEETSKSFEAAQTRYELRKVLPQKKNATPPKTK